MRQESRHSQGWSSKPAFHDNGLQASGSVRRQFHGLSSQAHLHVDGLHAPKRPTISRKAFTSPPTMRNACKQFAEFGDNFKDCLHHPPSRRMDCMHHWRPTFSRMVSTSPPSMRMACSSRQSTATISKIVFTSPPPGDGLHAPRWQSSQGRSRKPTFHEDGLQGAGSARRQFQGLSSQTHLP